jgi:pilus assembly protein CpaB
MMKPRSVLLLCVAGVCGLVAALAITQHLSGNQGGPQPSVPMKPIVVAVADQEPGIELKPEMVKLVETPEQEVPPGAFTDVAAVTGQTLRYPIYKGDVILPGKLGGAQTRIIIPPGMKGFTVRVGEEDRTGLINPRDNVDVWWLPSHTDVSVARVYLLLQNIEVGAVGQRLEAVESVKSAASHEDRGSDNYTLFVTPEQNRRLVAAMSMNGSRIRLTQRPKGDNSIDSSIDQEKLDILLGLKPDPNAEPVEEPIKIVAKPAPEPEPEMWEIEIVKPGKLSTERFPHPDRKAAVPKNQSS